MSTQTKDKDDLNVKEQVDGTVVVDLPKDMLEDEDVPQSTHEEDSDEADEAARDAELATGGEVDPEKEAIRAQRRDKRKAKKEYHKQVQVEKDLRLNHLSRVNQELTERIANLEKKSHGTDIARLESAIEDNRTRMAFAKQKIAEATENQNGELLASAQEMWYDARRNAETLESARRKMASPSNQGNIPKVDPIVQRNVNSWQTQNNWYDPANNNDPETRLVWSVDQKLTEEGWDARSPEYFEELDRRLQKYLPHYYNGDTEERQSTQRRPKSHVTGSGRENAVSSGGGGQQFQLTREQVSAMKEAGMWDDPIKRQKMIKRYISDARQNKGYRS